MRKRRDDGRAAQPALDPARLVFVDETWAGTNMARTHGRCPKGTRLVAAVPHGHGKTTTFVAALRADGRVAPTVIDGAVTGDRFVAYVEQQLAPTLRRDDVVVMDNLACHKRAGVRAAVEKAGAELRYLPPYRPDRNPIERAFSKLKARLRAAAKRTVRAVEDYLGELSMTFAGSECRNYFASCGTPSRHARPGTALAIDRQEPRRPLPCRRRSARPAPSPRRLIRVRIEPRSMPCRTSSASPGVPSSVGPTVPTRSSGSGRPGSTGGGDSSRS